MAEVDHQNCGASCRYRRLYEGGQLSLADMAARQAEALTRVARVRNGIVQALRHADPNRFASIEAELGSRLSEADDAVVLRVLDAWTARPTAPPAAAGDQGPGLAALRAALIGAGFALPASNDPNAWAQTVRQHRTRPASDPRDRTATPGASQSPGPIKIPTASLGDLFAPREPYGDEPVVPVTGGATLGDLFARAEDADPRAEAPGATLGDLFGTDPGAGASFDDSPLDDSPLDDSPLDHSPFDDSPFDDSPLNDSPFDDSPFDGSLAEVEGVVGGGEAGDLKAATDILDETFGDLHDVAEALASSNGSATEPPGATGQGVSRATLPPAPLRPTLPTARETKKRTGGKAARVAATRPDIADGAAEEAAPTVPAERFDALLAAVSVNRPVFLDDLRAVVPEAGVLEHWEKTMRSDATAPVRFLPAKSRHRALGALVIPRDHLKELAGGKGWWPECVERYRGNRLYELGVLLRRVGSSVVSHRLGEHTVVLRCNDARGLSGMVVALDPDLGETSPARAEVAAALDELLRERLTLIAVLGVVDTAIGPLEELLRDEAAVRGWTPTMPVALDRSWRWGESGTADVILGG